MSMMVRARNSLESVWAYCVAAYVLIVDLLYPFSVEFAELAENGSELIISPSQSEKADQLLDILGRLGMLVSIDLHSDRTIRFEEIPPDIVAEIGEMLSEGGCCYNSAEVERETFRLLHIVETILKRNENFHFVLTQSLITGYLTADKIEDLKDENYDYCSDLVISLMKE